MLRFAGAALRHRQVLLPRRSGFLRPRMFSQEAAAAEEAAAVAAAATKPKPAKVDKYAAMAQEARELSAKTPLPFACSGCGVRLQTTHKSELGYLPRVRSSRKLQDTPMCRRCYNIKFNNKVGGAPRSWGGGVAC